MILPLFCSRYNLMFLVFRWEMFVWSWIGTQDDLKELGMLFIVNCLLHSSYACTIVVLGHRLSRIMFNCILKWTRIAIMMRDDGNTLHSCLINSCCILKVDDIILVFFWSFPNLLPLCWRTHTVRISYVVEPFWFISLELVMGYIIFDKFDVEELFSCISFLLFFSFFWGGGSQLDEMHMELVCLALIIGLTSESQYFNMFKLVVFPKNWFFFLTHTCVS